MPRKKKSSKVYEKALQRMAALKSIDPNFDFGGGVNAAGYQQAIDSNETDLENYNITLFTRGTADTLTVYVGSKIRTGITPTMNALALILILLTVLGAVCYEVSRRRAERQAQQESSEREALELIAQRTGEITA